LVGFGVEIASMAPSHALVFVNPSTNEYLSPPCFADGAFRQPLPRANAARDPIAAGLVPMSKRDAGRSGARQDPICTDAGGFSEDMSLLTSLILGHQLLKPKRWEPDGSWNW
jgi:hypothetical protein